MYHTPKLIFLNVPLSQRIEILEVLFVSESIDFGYFSEIIYNLADSFGNLFR